MAEVKGITISFRGDTSDFQKAVNTVNADLKKTKSEISLLNKQLKFDPKNVETLTKKFDLLRQKEKELTELTKTLQDGMKNFDPNTKEWEKYNSQLQKAEVELQAIRNELSTMPTAQLSVASQTFEEWSKNLEDVGGKIESVGKKLSVLSAGIIGLATAGINYNAQLEQFQTAYTTLIGDAEKAQQTLEQIQESASKTPFSTASLVEANQYLISAGVEAEESQKMILALGDAISATGGGDAELQRMAQNLQQIKNLGKASAVDIKQFANAGINIYGLLAETTGKTVDQLKKMDVTYDQLYDAFTKASSEGGKYFGAMDKQSQTLNGSVSSLKDQINQLLGELTADLLPIIKDVLQFIRDLITYFRELDPEQQNMIKKIAGIITILGPALTIFGKITTALGGISGWIAKFLKNQQLIQFITQIVANGGGLVGILQTLWQILLGLMNPITILIGILVVLYATNEDIRNAVNALVEALVGMLKPAWDLIVTVVQIVWALFKELLKVALKLWEQFADSEAFHIFIEIVKQVIEWVTQLIEWITTLIGWLQEAANWFLNLIGLASDFNGASSGVGGMRAGHGEIAPMSGGYGSLNSGGFQSGGITLNASFNVQTNNVTRNDVEQWSGWLVDSINTKLGQAI